MAIICPKCRHGNPDGTRFCGHCAAPLGAGTGTGLDAGSLTKTLETPVRVLKADALIAGKYKIIEEVGAGGMGVVYKAEDLKLKRSVALKFLPPHLMDSPELKERFLVEAQAAAALSHPNICVIHEVGEDKSCPYIAMEYVEGETLRARVRKGPLKTEEAVDIILQVAAGLGEAHGKGIIHRDIKSANIMVTAKGRAKVMDFGLAKLRGGSSLTKTQTTLGTVAYMSPEQARGEELDQRTDIWSLGVVLYELLAGKLPFRGDHDQTVIYSILHKERESLIKIRPSMAPELDHVVGQALTKKAADRYRTMEELREDLSAVAEGLKPFRARPAGRTVLGLRASYVYPALAALLALALGLNVGGVRERLIGRSDSPALSLEPEKSIAVLPFINDSPDQENTYFINGVMEEILNNLQRIKSLRVISRTSVEQYRERKKSIGEIAEELGVNYIVDGSAQQYGNAFRLRAQLIMAAGETHLWGESFQRKIIDVEDIFDIQTKIAESIAAELRAVISPEEKRLIEKIPTTDLIAYENYLKGRFAVYKYNAEDLALAMQYFEKALERDPDFALAYAGIASVWMFLQLPGWAKPEEAGPKVKEAVEKALELDNSLAEVHYMLANLNLQGLWDWEASELSYKKTIEINPNHAEAHGVYSQLLYYLGRQEEARRHAELSIKLDPLNQMVTLWHAHVLLYDGRYDDCIARLHEVLEKNPRAGGFNATLSDAYHMKGQYDEAIEWTKKWILNWGFQSYGHDFDQFGFGHVFDQYEKLGYAGTMNLIADTLLAQSKAKRLSPGNIAMLYCRAGNKERALDCLELAYDMRDFFMYAGSIPTFAILHDEPRYHELMRKLNLPINRMAS